MNFDSVGFEQAISDEILCQIFLFLNVESLLVTPVVCKRWNATESNDELLWAPHVHDLWREKIVNQPTEKMLRKRVKFLPLSTLKRALFRVDISRCIEKPDFHNMLIARLIFGDRSPVKRQSRLYYPDWALRIGQFPRELRC